MLLVLRKHYSYSQPPVLISSSVLEKGYMYLFFENCSAYLLAERTVIVIAVVANTYLGNPSVAVGPVYGMVKWFGL